MYINNLAKEKTYNLKSILLDNIDLTKMELQNKNSKLNTATKNKICNIIFLAFIFKHHTSSANPFSSFLNIAIPINKRTKLANITTNN